MKTLFSSLLAIAALCGNAFATEMQLPDPPPNPPPCPLGKVDPSCPIGELPYRYQAICPDAEEKTICRRAGDPIPVYMACDSYGDFADCTAKPDTKVGGALTYTWTKSGRIALMVWGQYGENASIACATTRGGASVTLTVTSSNGSSGSETMYLNCSNY